MPIVTQVEIKEIKVCGKVFKTKRPFVYEVRYDAKNERYEVKGKFGVCVNSSSLLEAGRIIKSEIAMLLNEYVLAYNDDMTNKHISIRNELLSVFQEQK